MSAAARAANAQNEPLKLAADSTSLAIEDNAAYVQLLALAAQNIDVILTPWYEGREIIFRSSAASTNNITWRSNQAGSNIKLAASAVTLSLLPGGFIKFRAATDANGNEFWYQSAAKVEGF